MTTKLLQAFLHTHIPATAALGIQVLEADREHIALTMPHTPNRNHKNTAFGGSIALGATTCGWALVHCHLPEAQGNIVIQQGETRYLRPARGDLTIKTRPVAAESWRQMNEMFARRGKGKVVLEIDVFSEGEPVAVFTGKFVALKD
ncbi:YiiD C-terminal domain-containing protein [Neisseria sp. CCUG12390]|uniref:YiiD C-terminal domain-containing protein n=1 Tax=Neisseria sp. CCUG12390 TaxID=3392035 RepID=UPI003A100BD2